MLHPQMPTKKRLFYFTNLHPTFPLFRLISVDKFFRCFTNGVNKGYDHQQSEQKHKHISGVLFICLWPVEKFINLSLLTSTFILLGERLRQSSRCLWNNNVSTLSVTGEIFSLKLPFKSNQCETLFYLVVVI